MYTFWNSPKVSSCPKFHHYDRKLDSEARINVIWYNYVPGSKDLQLALGLSKVGQIFASIEKIAEDSFL